MVKVMNLFVILLEVQKKAMNDDTKTAIARMITQKNASKESKPVIKKKVVIKKQPSVITKKTSDPDLSIDESKLREIQNLMELIDIRKIVHDLVHKKLVYLCKK